MMYFGGLRNNLYFWVLEIWGFILLVRYIHGYVLVLKDPSDQTSSTLKTSFSFSCLFWGGHILVD